MHLCSGPCRCLGSQAGSLFLPSPPLPPLATRLLPAPAASTLPRNPHPCSLCRRAWCVVCVVASPGCRQASPATTTCGSGVGGSPGPAVSHPAQERGMLAVRWAVPSRTCSSVSVIALKWWFFSAQDKRDASESAQTHHREDGQPEVHAAAGGPPAQGGQHARPAGHRGARAAAPQLVASENTHRGWRRQPCRWCSCSPSVAFVGRVVLTRQVVQ